MVRCIAFVLSGLILTGCGHSFASRKTAEKGTIRGKVTVNGKPLPGAMIAYVDRNGNASKAYVLGDGTFNVGGVGAGPNHITLNGEDVPQSSNITSGRAIRRIKTKLPEKYLSPSTTPLTYVVRPGMQEHEFDVTIDPDELARLNPGGLGESKPQPTMRTPDKRGNRGNRKGGEPKQPEEKTPPAPQKAKSDPPKSEAPKK